MTPEVEARRKAATKASIIRVYELKLALAKNETDKATLRANIAKAIQGPAGVYEISGFERRGA